VCRIKSNGISIFVIKRLEPLFNICRGFVGGLVSRWNANFEPVSTYALHELGRVFKIINLYGPHGERKIFWEGLKDSGLMQGDDVILGVISIKH